MMRFLGAAVLIVVLIATGCSGGGVTPSGRLTHTASHSGAVKNASPNSAGPSFVEITGVLPEYQIASDGAGGEWFGNGLFHQGLVRVDETTRGVHEFPHPIHPIEEVGAGGVDNKMWFASEDAGIIGDIDLQTHNIKFRNVFEHGIVRGITAGPNGSIWFTQPFQNKIGVLDPSTFGVQYFTASEPEEIALGSDGGVWFTTLGTHTLGRIDPLSHHVAYYDAPSSEGFAQGLTSGPDGAIWFSIVQSSDKIGRLDIASHTFTFYTYAGPCGAEFLVTRDSKIWFSTCGGVGKISPTTGAVHLFTIPNHSQSVLLRIARGADDQLWLTEANSAHRIWEFCPDLGPADCATHARPFTDGHNDRRLIAGTLVSVGSGRR